jgi:hypothetical protein
MNKFQAACSGVNPVLQSTVAEEREIRVQIQGGFLLSPQRRWPPFIGTVCVHTDILPTMDSMARGNLSSLSPASFTPITLPTHHCWAVYFIPSFPRLSYHTPGSAKRLHLLNNESTAYDGFFKGCEAYCRLSLPHTATSICLRLPADFKLSQTPGESSKHRVKTQLGHTEAPSKGKIVWRNKCMRWRIASPSRFQRLLARRSDGSGLRSRLACHGRQRRRSARHPDQLASIPIFHPDEVFAFIPRMANFFSRVFHYVCA